MTDKHPTEGTEPSETLLPCPFCDGDAALGRHIEFGAFVNCTVCLASTNLLADRRTPAEAIAAWNRRVASVAQPTPEVLLGETMMTELRMNSIAEGLPIRDEERGGQTILTFCEEVGTWDLAFFSRDLGCDEEFTAADFLGASHWLDITGMWPRSARNAGSSLAEPGPITRYAMAKLPGSVTLLPCVRDDGEWVKFADVADICAANQRLRRSLPEALRVLAMLSLQSDRYRQDEEYRDAVDVALDWTVHA